MSATVALRRAAAACILLAPCAVQAQPYPTKTVRVVVAFAPGGGTDILARAVSQKLTEAWGQSFVVDNRPGASGNIGTEMVARAAPDGYTLLATSSGPFVLSPSLFPKLPYDAVSDFAPVTLGVTYAYLLVSHPSVPARSIKELVALARSRPGQLSIGSGGIATPPHLIAELFNLLAGVRILHVPFKGTGAALIDLLGGHVDLLFGNLPSQLPHVRSGKLRPLGITTPQRSELLPAVPTIAEAGVPGFEANAWMGWLAPAGTPRDIVLKLQTQIAAIQRQPEMRQRLLSEGAEPGGQAPEAFAEFMRVDRAKWAKVVQAAKITAQ